MKNFQIITLLFILLLSASSCDKDDISTNVDFELGYNEVAKLNSQALQFKVIEVLEDSRCPIDAYCSWAGTIKLKLEVTLNGNTTEKEIYYLYNDPAVVVGDYEFQLKKVTPENENNKVIALEDYVFTFLITEV